MLALLLLALEGSAVTAAPSGGECLAAMARAETSLVARGARVQVVRGTADSPHNPHTGKDTVVFRLDSTQPSDQVQRRTGAVMVMTNAPLQDGLAKDLFSACPQLVEVTFNMAGTDEATTLFRGADGSLLPGVCLEIGISDTWPTWGELYCP
ncbi:hypothetical protein [Cyanobium gracile]|uniref:Uncharacterized protein n=1 Tax=Cyanobium gracile UHCC 0281 TaxID=3110309 RepID=A0ABU5SZ92_9CYAN|nr:hypothetical protein [Cyanobium gracile]MEA5443844.1 hypothetical protein [Cyanobium gracile UHCC 0281]